MVADEEHTEPSRDGNQSVFTFYECFSSLFAKFTQATGWENYVGIQNRSKFLKQLSVYNPKAKYFV
jgi:hypothetical protein